MAIRSAYRVKNTVEELLKSKESENTKVNTTYALDIVNMA